MTAQYVFYDSQGNITQVVTIADTDEAIAVYDSLHPVPFIKRVPSDPSTFVKVNVDTNPPTLVTKS